MPFLLAGYMIGNLDANGVLGLAPSGGKQNIIMQLKEQGQISKAIVGLNYENPSDTDQKSQISLGEINFNEI